MKGTMAKVSDFVEEIYIMEQQALIPHLFRKGYRKITTVMRKPLGIDYIKMAEEILPAKISFSFFNEKKQNMHRACQ